MHAMPTWNLDATSILTRSELAAVLTDLTAKAPRSANAMRNLVIFRLACCCGLRVSEIAALQLDDVVLDTPRPHLSLRAATTKGKRARRVPLWWDSGTLADVAARFVTRPISSVHGWRRSSRINR
jgi:integrase